MAIHVTRDDILKIPGDPREYDVKPAYIGQMCLNILRKECYIAFGTNSNAWKLVDAGDIDINLDDLTADKIFYRTTMDEDINTVKDALDKLLYKDLVIGHFTCDEGTTFELGTIVRSLYFTWSYDRGVISQNINNEPIDRYERSYEYNSPFGSNKTFTLTADDGTKVFTKSLGITFMNRGYWGASVKPDEITANFVKELHTTQLISTRIRDIGFNAGPDEYIYYAIPTRLATGIVFSSGGFTGGFKEVKRLMVENTVGYSEEYCVYQSDNPNLGVTTINIR